MEISPPMSGQMFMYREWPRLFRRQAGAGQVLEVDSANGVVLIRVFNVCHEELSPLIGVIPLTLTAYRASTPKPIKMLDVPSDCQLAIQEWRREWLDDKAGVFSVPLREVTRSTFETVNHLTEYDVAQHAYVELAYPKRSKSGDFNTIAAFVRADAKSESCNPRMR